jgi:NTP pyrophosphatase (non-canonical NTP hydrolase)
MVNNTDGHKLAAKILKIHGTDRYPTVETMFMKLVEELGEFAQAILKNKSDEEIGREYADTGLCLYRLGTLLGMDLIEQMSAKVESETRKFSVEDIYERR